jgi:hypothetical protein
MTMQTRRPARDFLVIPAKRECGLLAGVREERGGIPAFAGMTGKGGDDVKGSPLRGGGACGQLR